MNSIKLEYSCNILYVSLPRAAICWSVSMAFPGHTQLLFALNGELKESLSFHSVNGSKSQIEGPSSILTFKECLDIYLKYHFITL